MREHCARERTALINRLLALLAEFRIIMPKGRAAVQREIPLCLEDADNSLPAIARAALADSYDHLQVLNQRIEDTEQCFEMLVEASSNAQRIMKVRGIGPQSATTVLASIGKAEQFDTGRDFATWLGLIPKQYSTGGKPRLGRISKRGNKYLRTLLVHGARTVVANLGEKQDRLSQCCRELLARRGMNRTIVALAANNARIIWA